MSNGPLEKSQPTKKRGQEIEAGGRYPSLVDNMRVASMKKKSGRKKKTRNR
jgi:hypothetical protein